MEKKKTSKERNNEILKAIGSWGYKVKTEDEGVISVETADEESG